MFVPILLYIAASALLLSWGIKSFVTKQPDLMVDLPAVKFSALEVKDGAIYVTEGMMEIFLASAGVDALSNPQVTFADSGIEVETFDNTKRVLAMSMTPKVKKDKLVLEVTNVNYKGFNAPKLLTGALDKVTSLFAESVNVRMSVESVALENKAMRIQGTMK